MPKNEVGILVTRRRPQLCLVCGRANVRSQRLYRSHLRRIHVAVAAELPRMTGGARLRDFLLTICPGQLSMQSKGKIGSLVRGWCRKFGYILAGKTHGSRKRNVTGSTTRIRRRQVCGPDLMAVETALHHSEADLHSLATNCVASFASER